jgi:hypothetical protein
MRRVRVGGALAALALAGAMATSGFTGGNALAQEEVSISVVEPGAPATPIGETELADPTTGTASVLTLAYDQWTGAAMVDDISKYGRHAAALYSQATSSGTGTIDFRLGDMPSGDALLILVGLDDDAAAKTQIELTINTTVVYTGESWFNNWDGTNDTSDWTTVQVLIPRGMLGSGVNSVTISNMSASGNEGEAPFVLLGASQLTVPGVSAEATS